MTALSWDNRDGVAWVVFDLPGEPVNKITRGVRAELEVLFNQLRGDRKVNAVVFASGKPDNFIAGADIDEFVALKSGDEALQLVRGGQELVNQFGELGKPVVAAIHGACVGGGLESALACQYRIATSDPKTSLGLPEVKLGILPAAGGCQRLPRLIGLQAALDIILAGKVVPAKRAHRLGMVDELVHPAILEDVAQRTAKKLAEGWKPRRGARRGVVNAVLEGNPLGRRVVFSKAASLVRKRSGGDYPAPFAALDAVRHGLAHGIQAGLDREAKHFAELAVSDVSRKLVQIFFATTELKKDPGVAHGVAARAVRNVAVVGSGFMGAGIGGTAVARAHVDLRLRDTDLARVQKGLATARGIVKDGLRRRRISKFEFRRLDALLSGGADWGGFGRADVVIEAVFEDLDVKHQVVRDVELHVRPECVLATNTSTIPIGDIAKAARHPERVIGMHFFSPVEKMPLLEVIVHATTSPEVAATAVAFGKRMGKTVIVVRDRPGFWVNRILSPYLNEAVRMVHEGVSVDDLDRTMKRFGFPVGPITLLDEVGLDVALKASRVMHAAFGDRMAVVDGVAAMIDAGRLGRKGGEGFYRYDKGKRQGVDQRIYDIVTVDPRPVPAADVERRLVYAMLNEAALALSEGVVASPRDGDIGAIFGIGYPPFRGGPLRQLDDFGAAAAVDILQRLTQAYGERFQPAPALVEMAEHGRRFYPND